MAGQGQWALPNILFYVSEHPTFDGPEPQRLLDEAMNKLHIAQRRKRGLDIAKEEDRKAGVVFRSEDGRNVVREHVVARL